MKFLIIFVMIITAVSISGQFLGAEFSVGSVPLNLRRGSFEISQSVGREIESQADETATNSNQGGRHIETQRNIRDGPNRNVNNFNIGQDQSNNDYDRVPLNRRLVTYRGQNGNDANQFNTQVQESNLLNHLRTNDRPSINRDTERQNNGDKDLTNQYINEYSKIQEDSPSSDKVYENRNQQNENRRQDTQNNNLIASNIRTSTTRTIITENSQNNVNQNENIGSNSRLNENLNREDGAQNIPNEDPSKSALDNELSNNRSRSEEKWVWTGEVQTTTKAAVVPDVDDRAAFTGNQCPTGKVKFNNSCVERD